MSWLGRKRGKPERAVEPGDTSAISALLQDAGASAEEAAEIVELLGQRLNARQMRDWLCDSDTVHMVRDPDTIAEFGFAMAWTPINAVDRGKTHLVIRSARLFAAGEEDPLEPDPLPEF